MILAGGQHPERLRCYLIRHHTCFKLVTKWWWLFSRSQNMKVQKKPNVRGRNDTSHDYIWNYIYTVFSWCVHSLSLGRFWGPSSQWRNTFTGEDTQPWFHEIGNWCTPPPGHLGLSCHWPNKQRRFHNRLRWLVSVTKKKVSRCYTPRLLGFFSGLNGGWL